MRLNKKLSTLLSLLFVMSFGLAQSVSVTDFASLEKTYSAKDNKVHVLCFFATWAKPSLALVDQAEQLNKAGLSNVELTLVSMDFSDKMNSVVKPFLKSKSISAKTVLLSDNNPNQWVSKIHATWSGNIPAVLFVNAAKNKKAFFQKSMSFAELKEKVEQMR